MYTVEDYQRPGRNRSPKLQRRNRQVMLIVLSVVAILVIGTVVYVAFLGGDNIERRTPLGREQTRQGTP